MHAAFEHPVTVWLGPAGNTKITVTNAVHAARLLTEEWPETDSKAFEDAAAACLNAINGADAATAEHAFESAARNAGVLG